MYGLGQLYRTRSGTVNKALLQTLNAKDQAEVYAYVCVCVCVYVRVCVCVCWYNVNVYDFQRSNIPFHDLYVCSGTLFSASRSLLFYRLSNASKTGN